MRDILDRIEWVTKMKKLTVSESTYPGNLGMVEMMKFYKVATVDQENKMNYYLDKGKFRAAWRLLQKVTGNKLKGIKSNKKKKFKERKHFVG